MLHNGTHKFILKLLLPYTELFRYQLDDTNENSYIAKDFQGYCSLQTCYTVSLVRQDSYTSESTLAYCYSWLFPKL